MKIVDFVNANLYKLKIIISCFEYNLIINEKKNYII